MKPYLSLPKTIDAYVSSLTALENPINKVERETSQYYNNILQSNKVQELIEILKSPGRYANRFRAFDDKYEQMVSEGRLSNDQMAVAHSLRKFTEAKYLKKYSDKVSEGYLNKIYAQKEISDKQAEHLYDNNSLNIEGKVVDFKKTIAKKARNTNYPTKTTSIDGIIDSFRELAGSHTNNYDTLESNTIDGFTATQPTYKQESPNNVVPLANVAVVKDNHGKPGFLKSTYLKAASLAVGLATLVAASFGTMSCGKQQPTPTIPEPEPAKIEAKYLINQAYPNLCKDNACLSMKDGEYEKIMAHSLQLSKSSTVAQKWFDLGAKYNDLKQDSGEKHLVNIKYDLLHKIDNQGFNNRAIFVKYGGKLHEVKSGEWYTYNLNDSQFKTFKNNRHPFEVVVTQYDSKNNILYQTASLDNNVLKKAKIKTEKPQKPSTSQTIPGPIVEKNVPEQTPSKEELEAEEHLNVLKELLQGPNAIGYHSVEQDPK